MMGADDELGARVDGGRSEFDSARSELDPAVTGAKDAAHEP